MRLLDEEYVMEEVALGFKPSGMESNYVPLNTHIFDVGHEGRTIS